MQILFNKVLFSIYGNTLAQSEMKKEKSTWKTLHGMTADLSCIQLFIHDLSLVSFMLVQLYNKNVPSDEEQPTFYRYIYSYASVATDCLDRLYQTIK